MRNLIIILALIATLGSCNNKNKQLDPDAKLSITGVSSPVKSQNNQGILGTEITDSVEFILKYAWAFKNSYGSRAIGFLDGYMDNRDFINKKFKFSGNDVINSKGELAEIVMQCDDFVFTTGLDKNGKAQNPQIAPIATDPEYLRSPLDTIAYIPQSVILTARAAITKAFNEGDYETCYKLFDNAYVFIPTTGAKWRALKAQGKH